ncbi:MAG: Maf family protein, partial [Aggregatilineales bacterium]
YVQRLSQQKAAAVATQLDESAAILAADTVVILASDATGIIEDSEILGKPANATQAKVMLQRLRNRTHTVCTAFTILVTGDTSARHTEVVCTQVIMRDYSDTEIDTYIATGDPFDKAGSYAIQHEGFHPVARIEGNYNNVVGLPIDEVQIAIENMHLSS